MHLLRALSEVIPAGPDPLLVPVLPSEFYRENEARARETLGGLLEQGWGTPPSVISAVKSGGPVEAILDYASDQEIDLVVIATHGRTGLSHVLLGSVAERIVREAPCPVMTIRDREQTPPLRGV